jgi:plastocyanin
MVYGLSFPVGRPLQMLVLAVATGIALSAVALVGQGFAQDQDLKVDAKDYWFEPTYRTVPVGATVTWTNGDEESHTVTSDLGLFDQEIWPGDHWSFTFAQPGVYFYFCQPHDWMIGEITVAE